MSARNAHAMLVAAALLSAATGANAQVYVGPAGDFAPDGSPTRPYQMVQHAVCASPTGSEIRIAAGSYPSRMVIGERCRLTAQGGSVTLGSGAVTTNFRIVSYNTHLFGNTIDGIVAALQHYMSMYPILGPIINAIIENEVDETAWADDRRAAQIALRTAAENADVVCLQEVWDVDHGQTILNGFGASHWFYGGYNAPAYVELGKLGSVELGFSLNSGLFMLSDHALNNPSQVVYSVEDGFFESIATKSFVQATIVKDGVSVGVFNTHTQSGDEFNDNVLITRNIQMFQLAAAVFAYRNANPGNPVIVVGDLNVNGNNWLPFSEYLNSMRSMLGSTAPLRDVAANARCFAAWDDCTSCSDNELHGYFYPDNHHNTRLDYVFYCDSLDGSTKIRPTSYNVRDYEANSPISENGFTTRDLSDHYGVVVDFQITR